MTRVYGTYKKADGSFEDGYVKIYPMEIANNDGSIITQNAVEKSLRNGYFSVNVLDSNDPSWPDPMPYYVEEHFLGKDVRKYTVLLTGASVDLATIIPDPTLVYTIAPGGTGEPGAGVPVGGTTGQILAKASNTDLDTEWIDGSTTDHGGLTGLGDDDHLQYALADGTRGAFAPPHSHNYDATGTADAAVAAHVALPDPHTQYLTSAEGNAAYDALGAAESAVAAHTALPDPHTQYLTTSEAGSLYEASGAVTGHVSASDPHTQYQKESERGVANGYASLDANTKIPVAQIPTGTAAGTVATGDHGHNYVAPTRSVISGGGLTGGGDLSLDRTLAVGAGTGITVNPDEVAVNRAVVDTWYESAGSVATHTGQSDPHPQYLTPAEADAAYDAIGAAAGAVSTHEAGLGVHAISGVTGLQTALDGKSATTHNHDGVYDPAGTTATHEAALDPHPQYVTDAEHALINHAGLPGVGTGGGAAIFFGNNVSNPDPTTYNFWVVTA